MRHVSRTHRVALDWLFGSGPHDPNQKFWHQKSTCWHADQREFHAWRVEPSSSFVEHNEFLDVLLQPIQQLSFWSDRKRHVKERSRSDFQWRFTDGEAKTNGSSKGETRQLGFTQPVGREGKSSAGFGISGQSGECRWRTRQSYWYKDTCTHHPKPRCRTFSTKFRFLKKKATRRNLRTPLLQGDLYGQRLQEPSLKHEVHEPSLQDEDLPFPTIEVGNNRKILNIFNGSFQDKCVDMGNVHVFVDESSHSSWTELFGEPGGLQEHELRGISELVQYHTEIDKGASWRNSEFEYDWTCISLMDEISIVSWTSDSVDRGKSMCLLRFRSMLGNDEWKQRCKHKMEGQVDEFKMSPSYKELLGIDGETIDFEWNIFPGFSSLQVLQEIQNDLRERNIKLEKFTDRIIFMSMFNDIDWTRKGNVKEHAMRFSQGHWTFSVLETKRSGMELFLTHLKENGTLQPLTCWNDSKIQVIQYSRVSVLWVVGSWKERVAGTPNTSMRMLGTPSSCSDSFIL